MANRVGTRVATVSLRSTRQRRERGTWCSRSACGAGRVAARGRWRADLADRYRAEGWWTDATLGRWWPTAWRRMADAGFRVRSKVRPWPGTFADVDRAARSLAGRAPAAGRRPRRRGRVPAAQLGGGRHHVLGRRLPRRRRGADRPLLRRQGGRLHPPRHRARRRRHRRPLRPRRPPGHVRGRCWRADPVPLLAGGRRHARRRRCRPRPTPFDDAARRPSPSPGRPPSTPTRRRSSASRRARPATRRASSTRTARSAARPASSTTCSRRAARRRSPARRSATSSGCSTPSSCRCCATGPSTWSTCGTRARCCA